MLTAIVVTAAASLLASSAEGASHELTHGSPHLSIMSYYGFNPPLMAGWVNMGLESSLSSKLAAWTKYKIPSFCARPPVNTHTKCQLHT